MKILLPLDDSEYTQKNLDFVKKLAKKLDAGVTLLHVVALPSVSGVTLDFRTFEKAGKALVDEHGKKLEAEGLRVETKVKVGYDSSAGMIVDEATKGGYDMVALGAMGSSSFVLRSSGGVTRNILVGSVADSVARNAPCSVLIIR